MGEWNIQRKEKKEPPLRRESMYTLHIVLYMYTIPWYERNVHCAEVYIALHTYTYPLFFPLSFSLYLQKLHPQSVVVHHQMQKEQKPTHKEKKMKINLNRTVDDDKEWKNEARRELNNERHKNRLYFQTRKFAFVFFFILIFYFVFILILLLKRKSWKFWQFQVKAFVEYIRWQ